MAFILVTFFTFHAEMSWLNDEALQNMYSIDVTELRSQSPMSGLQTSLYCKSPSILVTSPVCQVVMLPYVCSAVALSEHQALKPPHFRD